MDFNMTPLYLAFDKGNIEVIKLLFANRNIDVNLKDRNVDNQYFNGFIFE